MNSRRKSLTKLPSLVTAVVVCTLISCGSPIAGTYHAEVQPISGAEQTDTLTPKLESMRQRLADEPRALEIAGNGRYVWHEGGESIEGNWRIEGEHIIFRDDTRLSYDITCLLREGAIIRRAPYEKDGFEVIYRKR